MKPNHSGLGIASFTIGLVAGVAILLLFVMAGVTGATAPSGVHEKYTETLGISIVAFAVINIFALGLGIAALFQKGRKKTFAVLGTAFSAIAILITSVLMFIGNAPDEVAVAMPPSGKNATGLTGAIRDNFVSSAHLSCFENQRSLDANQRMSSDQLTSYCVCNSSYMADRLGNDEVVGMESGGNQELISKFKGVYSA